MTDRRIVLISLRFKPAFLSLLSAFARASHDLGFEVEFLLEAAYLRCPELASTRSVFCYSKNQTLDSYSHALFLNVSLQNKELASRLRNRGVKILYLYHEPWNPSLEYLRTEGVHGSVRAALAHRASVPMLK